MVELEVDKPDGTRVEVKLLRPLAWLQQAGAIEHGTFPLNVEELDIDGEAAVLKILPCPPIQSGDGQVVTGTFRHTCNDLVQLHIQGEPAPIVCTSGHPIWSEERQAFVRAGQLQFGEILKTVAGKAAVTQVNQLERQIRLVVNLELNRTHTYFVGLAGQLAHNAGVVPCTDPSRNYDREERESKSSKTVKDTEAVDTWDAFLGPNQTDIDPRDGLRDPDRIWSEDGKRSIRFGDHETSSPNPNKHHFHMETWYNDYVENVLQRIQKTKQ